MGTSQQADHALGLELQLEELVEQRERARVQGRHADLPGIDAQIAALQEELASAAEAATAGTPIPAIAAPPAAAADRTRRRQLRPPRPLP